MPNITLPSLAKYFLLLGGTVFGGPLALCAHIKAELVERRGWLSSDEYKEGLAMATALPGPIAYQLGIYAAWLRRGWMGGLVAAGAFLLPPFLLCLIGAILYQRYRETWVLHALFYGVGPVIIALILKAGYKMGRTTFAGLVPWGIGLIGTALVTLTHIDPTWLFIAAALLGVFTHQAKAMPKNNVGSIEVQLGLFFFKAACVLFGSGLVIIPMIQRYVVDQYHWLDIKTFVDAVAVGMMTPGPVVITATFVGYLAAGLAGAVTSTVGMFAPSVLFIFIGAPILRRYRGHRIVRGAVAGIAPAVVGVIFGASLKLGTTALVDPLTWGIAATALLCTLRWRVPDLALILAAGAVGVLVQ
ncbi:MAG: chromate transporter [Deltaproteobacteria bacterium]|nr:chromate transporter [Deltaproteobacteria bacterium]